MHEKRHVELSGPATATSSSGADGGAVGDVGTVAREDGVRVGEREVGGAGGVLQVARSAVETGVRDARIDVARVHPAIRTRRVHALRVRLGCVRCRGIFARVDACVTRDRVGAHVGHRVGVAAHRVPWSVATCQEQYGAEREEYVSVDLIHLAPI